MGIAEIAAIILPVFGLMAAGYLARLTGLLSDTVADGLSSYAYSVAIPCLLFRMMAEGNWPDISPWTYWITYFAGVAVAWIIAMVIVMKMLGREFETGIVAGFTASQANTVLVGIPLVLAVYGEAGRVPLVFLISIHLPLMMTVAAILMEASKAQGADWTGAAKAIIRSMATHPIVLSLAAGYLWHLTGIEISGTPRKLIDALAGTAGTVALFSLGLALRRYGIAGDLRATLSLTALKLVIHPIVVFLLGAYVFHLSPVWLGAAVLFASSPCGVNAYLVANRYGTGMRMSSSAIAVSSAVAVLTVGVWMKLIPAP
ncbi:MAG: AEC family transporter [Rhodobiaceae bacterium]|nr:AEC family transporter [Rhodobiaceae bacterium]